MIIINAINLFFNLLFLLILIRCFLSFGDMGYETEKKLRFLYYTTEPILEPFRKLTEKWQYGGMDFSPMLAILFLYLIRDILVAIISSML